MHCPWKLVIAGVIGAGIVNSPGQAASQIPSPILEQNSTALSLLSGASASESSASEPANREEDLLTQGRNLYSAGQFAAAAEAWQIAAETANARHDSQQQALSLSYLSLAYQALNQWDAARSSVAEARALLESANEPVTSALWAQVLNTQGSLVFQLGQAESALEIWQQAEDYYRQANDVSGRLGSQINQAQALQSLGFYRRSKQHLEAVAADLYDLPDSVLKVTGLRSLGTALQILGDLSASRDALFQSAEIAERIQATTELSATYLSLGATASDWGDLEAAITLFDQAKAYAQSPTDQLQAELNQLRVYQQLGETAKIAQAVPNIYQQLQTLPPSRLSIYSVVNFSDLLTEDSSLEKLLPATELNQLLANAVQSAQTIEDSQAEAYALMQQGKLYMKTQQWSEASILIEKSLTIARHLQADDIISQAAWQLGKILNQQGNHADAITAYSEAVNALEALRGDLVGINPEVQFSFRENVEPIYREMADLLLGDSPSQEAIAHARKIIEALQLAELDNFFQEACLDIESRQIDQVDPHATVVYSIVLPDRLAVITSTANQPLQYHAVPVSAATVEDTLQDLMTSIHPVSDNSLRLALSKQVYDWLITPVAAGGSLANTETLVFVLDGPLRNVPIAALYDGEQYLIENYAVALSPGLQLMKSQLLAQIEPNAVLAGISESRNGLSALPAVAEEIRDIGNLVPATTLLNQEFTSDAFAADVKNSSASIIHLATHGQFSSRLEDTFLSTWEGRLNVKELSEILQTRDQASPVELLVLSACDTATGDDRAVLGLAGLAVKSGVRSTIATLWPVKDQAAATLMEALYKNINTEDMTRAEALRQAQLTLLADPAYSDPFFWSAFTLVGNWR